MKIIKSCVAYILLVLTISGFSPSVRHRAKQANDLFDQSKYEEAFTAYADAQLHDPQNPALYFNMGDVLYKQRKYADALEMYRKASEGIDADIAHMAQYNVGCVLYREGKLKESLDTFKRVLEASPEDEDSKYNVEFIEQKIKEMLNQAQQRMQEQQQQSSSDQQSDQSEGEQQQQPQGGGKESSSNQEQEQQKSSEQNDQRDSPEEDDTQDGEEEQEKQEDTEGSQSAAHAGQDANPKDQSSARGQGAVQGRDDTEEMSKEDAERFLQSFDQQEEYVPKNNDEKSAYSNYRVNKDW